MISNHINNNSLHSTIYHLPLPVQVDSHNHTRVQLQFQLAPLDPREKW